MPTVIVTFVQAAYALMRFVQISNISAVTGPILTKLFGPNLCCVIIFVDQNVLGKNFFQTQNFIRAHSFRPENLLDPEKILNSNFFGPKIFSNLTLFFRPKIFLDPKFLKSLFSDQKVFLDPQFFSKIISGPKINFAPNFFQKFL